MLNKADYKWLAGFGILAALLILAFRFPVLAAPDQPLEYPDLEGYLRHTSVHYAPVASGLESNALQITRYGSAFQSMLGNPLFKIVTLLAAMLSGAALIILFYISLTTFSSNVIARYGSMMLLLQGNLIAHLSSNLTLSIGTLGLLGIIYSLGVYKPQDGAKLQPRFIALYLAFVIASLGLFYQIPLTLFLIYPTWLWILITRRTDMRRQKTLAALAGITLLVPLLFALLIAMRLGLRSLFYPLYFTELGFYNGFNDPLQGNWGNGLFEWGRDCVRFWLNVLIGFMPIGNRNSIATDNIQTFGYFATLPFLAIFAARGLSVRMSQVERNYLPVFSGVALLIIALPFIITLLPRVMQSGGFLPVIMLLLFFAVMGIEQFSGAFGMLAQRIFQYTCLALAIISASGLFLELGYSWRGIPKSRLHYSNLAAASSAKLEKEDSFASTFFSPAFMDVSQPVLILRGVAVKSEGRNHKLTGPGEWYEYIESLHFSQRPKLVISYNGEWPQLDLFQSLVRELPGQDDESLLIMAPNWSALNSGKLPEKDPALYLADEIQPLPDWALALTLVDTVDVAERFNETRHNYRSDRGLSEFYENQTLLNRKYHRTTYPLKIWDGGRIVRSEEQFELSLPYGENPGLLIFRTDSETTCTMRVTVGDFKNVKTIPPGYEQLWQESAIVIPSVSPSAVRTKKVDGNDVKVTDVRIEFDFGGSFSAFNSYNYWFYQSRIGINAARPAAQTPPAQE